MRITDAQVTEMVWAHSQCVHHTCPRRIFGKQLADEINAYFNERDR